MLCSRGGHVVGEEYYVGELNIGKVDIEEKVML